MDAGKVRQIETGVEASASALLAAAVGFAVYRYLEPDVVQPALGTFVALAVAAVFGTCWHLLALVDRRPPEFAFTTFDLGAVMPMRPLELVLTDADQLYPNQAADDALVLDDVLAELGPDSRVAQLFDPNAMPTAGELKARIDRHLSGGTSHAPSPDASQALYDALAELRLERASRR